MNAATAELIRETGTNDPEAILEEIARQALKRHPLDVAARHAAIAASVRHDPVLLWTLFAHFRAAAFDALVLKVRQIPPRQRAGDSTRAQHTKEAQQRKRVAKANAKDARAAVVRLSILDRFKIDGRPVGDYTPRWLRSYAADKRRDARFIELIIHGRPDDELLRNYTTADEADAAWTRAQEESGR